MGRARRSIRVLAAVAALGAAALCKRWQLGSIPRRSTTTIDPLLEVDASPAVGLISRLRPTLASSTEESASLTRRRFKVRVLGWGL